MASHYQQHLWSVFRNRKRILQFFGCSQYEMWKEREEKSPGIQLKVVKLKKEEEEKNEQKMKNVIEVETLQRQKTNLFNNNEMVRTFER